MKIPFAEILVGSMAAATVFTGCDQRPVDIAPKPPGITWRTLHELQPRKTLTAVWSSSANDVYAGSYENQASLIHFDGADWESVDYPANEDTENLDIWGAGPNDVYVADGRLHHFDGNTWVRQPIDADVVGGTAANEVYAADDQYVYYFNGSYWVVLYEVEYRYTPQAIWVGSSHYMAIAQGPYVTHRDGSNWWATGPISSFTDMWGSVWDDLYAVDSFRIWHYDGNEWVTDHTGLADRPMAVWGAGPDDIYAVGKYGEVLHFDGLAWTPNVRTTAYSLYGVHGTAASNIFAVGENGKVLHFDGSAWGSAREDKPPDCRYAWAETKDRLVAFSHPYGLHVYDGGTWKEEYPGDICPIQAFGGTAINDLFVSCGNRSILHYDGNEWSESARTWHGDQLAFWTAGPDDIFSVGSHSIYHFDGSGWSVMIEDGTYLGAGSFHLLDVWGSSSDIVFAVGSNGLQGLVLRYDGQAWTPMNGEFGWMMLGVWGRSESDVFAVGDGNIFHYDGNSWSKQPAYRGARPRWVTGRAPNLIVAADYGYLLRFDGLIWNYDEMEGSTWDFFAGVDGTVFRVTNYRISCLEE